MKSKKLKKLSLRQAQKLLGDAQREVINHTNGDEEIHWVLGKRKIGIGSTIAKGKLVFLLQSDGCDTTLFRGEKAEELFHLGRSVSKKKE
jgi:hypothetical protein